MSSSDVLSRQSFADHEVARLRCTFQASSLRQAVCIAATLRTTAAGAGRVRPTLPRSPGRREWTLTLTAPPMPLTLDALQSWEREMLAVEHRWPGSRFLGWSTLGLSEAPAEPLERPAQDAEDRRPRRSQRELVMASLLRCPPGERGGIVHGRAAPW